MRTQKFLFEFYLLICIFIHTDSHTFCIQSVALNGFGCKMWRKLSLTIHVVGKERSYYPFRASQGAQKWRIHLPMQKTLVRSLGWEDLLDKKMATRFSMLAWRIPWTEEPRGLQSKTVHKRVEHDWATKQQPSSFSLLWLFLFDTTPKLNRCHFLNISDSVESETISVNWLLH